jgi:hypothetical protein
MVLTSSSAARASSSGGGTSLACCSLPEPSKKVVRQWLDQDFEEELYCIAGDSANCLPTPQAHVVVVRKAVARKLFDLHVHQIRRKEGGGGASWDLFEYWANSEECCSSSIPREVLRDMHKSFKTIVIMDDQVDASRQVLEAFHGKLHDVSDALMKEMKTAMPDHPAAKVADFNENISYSMLDKRGLLGMFEAARGGFTAADGDVVVEGGGGSLPVLQGLVNEFESTLQAAVGSNKIQYQGSFLKTEETVPQPAHVDFTWEYLEEEGERLFIGFFPLTEEGMFLQFWENNEPKEAETGKVIYVPPGKLFIVPADTVHGGGFKTSDAGNPRFHLYIASQGKSLPEHQQNKYTEEHDRTKELCDRLTDAPRLPDLIELIFQGEG